MEDVQKRASEENKIKWREEGEIQQEHSGNPRLDLERDLPPRRVLRRYHRMTCIVPRFQRYRWLIRLASVAGAFVCAIAWGSYSIRYPSASIVRERWKSSAKVRGEKGPGTSLF